MAAVILSFDLLDISFYPVGLCLIITCIDLYFVVSIHSSFNVKHIVLIIALICVCVYLLYNLFKVSSLNDEKRGFIQGRLINVKHDDTKCVMVKIGGRNKKEQNRGTC